MSGLSTSLNEKQLFDVIKQCMIRDRYRLRGQLRRLKKDDNTGLAALQHKIEQSQQLVAQRRTVVPKIEYDLSLPVSDRRDEITETIHNHQVVIVAGETGSGKTTQLPKICLEAGRGIFGLIGHTQPRRLAARSVANRIADELHGVLGEQVGYQVRFSDHSTKTSLIKLMTDGILLAEIQNDRFLNRYDTLIIDEAHERSLNIDFLLGYIKLILPKRRDLKVIITSATIDVERFSKHFNNAPIIEVSGRTYPVETLYRPLEELELEGRDADQRLQQGILAALEEIQQLEHASHSAKLGDVLVFLSGEREIRETHQFLRNAKLPHTEILPLYARLSATEQNRIFHPHGGRRVILSTNVAETSLTVSGIRYVIDPGTARISRYSVRSKVQRLPVEAISQASANQRQGRCGRVAEGVCIRLYSEQDFLAREEFTDPEIVRTNLAAVILQMLSMGLGDIAGFPFVEPPDSKAINDGFKLLQELGAVDSKRRMTQIGRQLSQLPVDPRLGRMLVAANKTDALQELLIIVSALAVQDPRERPQEKQQAADQRHREFYHDDSDFLSYVNLWQGYEEQRQSLSQNQLRKYCTKQFLSFMRMREWRDLHRQLALACKDLQFKVNEEPASYGAVHKALLSGLLSQLGSKDDEADYMGARNRRFYLFPGSTLYKRKPKWVMAAELVETSRLFARTTAKIEPQWIEPAAIHLVKRNYFEPHWQKKRAQVVAFEQVTLYGLIVVGRRKVNYGAIDPIVSREIFIREALVEGHYNSKGAFQQHNHGLMEEVDKLESKARRRDILVDAETLYQFYDELLPAEVVNGAGFEAWRKEAERKAPQLLFLTKEYLMRHDAGHITVNRYPNHFKWNGMTFPLSYNFAPNEKNDGVTLTVPAEALKMLPKHRLEWLVPGMLFDKCVALVRSLPKPIRKNFVPVPDYITGALETLSACDEPLTEMLAKQLLRMSGVRILEDQWHSDSLDTHLLMNIRVVNSDGEILGEGRNLSELRRQFSEYTQDSIRQLAKSELEQEGLRDWSCGELPQEIIRKAGGLLLTSYPALVDQGDSVAVQLFENAAYAASENRKGLIRLFRLRLAVQLKFALSRMPKLKETQLLATSMLTKQQLEDDLQNLIIAAVYLTEETELPRDKVSFTALLNSRKSKIVPIAEKIDPMLNDIFRSAQNVSKKLKGKISFDWALALGDIKTHMQRLLRAGFMTEAGLEWFTNYPRYLKTIEMRLEKLGANVNKDRVYTEELTMWQQKLDKRLQQHQQHHLVDAELQLCYWMLEEYRVSLFAQKLGTKFPISEKRLRKQWELVLEV